MPFRVLLSNPITLAALAVVAIGVITYQILNNNHKRRLPASGRRRSRGTDYGSGRPDSPDNGRKGPDKPGKRPSGPSTDCFDHSGDGRGASGKAGNNPKESEKSSSDPNGLRKRNNVFKGPDDTSEPENLPVVYNNVNSSLSSFDKNSEVPGNINDQTRNVSTQNNENKETDGNVKLLNDKMTGFVPNISDEDSDSSESSDSQNSFKSNYSSTDSNESICDNESSCTNASKNIRVPTPIDSEEEMYKRKVCNYLKNDLQRENCSSDSNREKYFQDFNDAKSNTSENSTSVSSGASSSFSSPRKPKLCKGCQEELANAVVYPCKHCYLCLDCAIKVHRIYKKCSICQSVIKTFERSDA